MWDEWLLLTLTRHTVSLVVVNELNTDRNAITIRTHTPAVITHKKCQCLPWFNREQVVWQFTDEKVLILYKDNLYMLL